MIKALISRRDSLVKLVKDLGLGRLEEIVANRGIDEQARIAALETIIGNYAHTIKRSNELQGRIDLHHHTYRSDGYGTPSGVVYDAWKRGLSAIGIVDHNTFLGLAEASRAGELLGIEVFPAVEIDLFDDGLSIDNFHLLAYLPRAKNTEEFAKWLASLRQSELFKVIEDLRARYNQRQNNMRLKFNECRQDGLILNEDDVAGYLSDTPNRYQLGLALWEKYGRGKLSTNDYKETTKKYFPADIVPYEGRDGLDANIIVPLLMQIGAVSVVAHPGESGMYKDIAQIRDLILKYSRVKINDSEFIGIRGIEIYSSKHSQKKTAEFMELVEELNRSNDLFRKYPLIVTIGTDTHNQSGVEIGIGNTKDDPRGNIPGDLPIDEIMDNFKASFEIANTAKMYEMLWNKFKSGLDNRKVNITKSNFNPEGGVIKPNATPFVVHTVVLGKPLPPDIEGEITKIQSQLRDMLGEGKLYLNPVELLHITLFRIEHPDEGPLEESKLKEAEEQAREVVSQADPFSIFIEGVAVTSGGVVIAKGIPQDLSFFNLRSELEKRINFSTKKQGAMAHITVARILEPLTDDEKIRLQNYVLSLINEYLGEFKVTREYIKCVSETQWYLPAISSNATPFDLPRTNEAVALAFKQGRISQDPLLVEDVASYLESNVNPAAANLVRNTRFSFILPETNVSPRSPPSYLWYDSANRFVLAHAGTFGNQANAYIPQALINTLVAQNALSLIAKILLHEATDANELISNLPVRASHQSEVDQILAELKAASSPATIRFPPQASDLTSTTLPEQIKEYWRDVHHVYMDLTQPNSVRKEALEKAFRIAARKHDLATYPEALEIWKNAKDMLTEFYIAWPQWEDWKTRGQDIWGPALEIAKEAFMDVDAQGVPKQFWVYSLLLEAVKPALGKGEYNAGLVEAVVQWLESSQPAPLKSIAAEMLGEMGISQALPLLISGLSTEEDTLVFKAYIKAIRALGKKQKLEDIDLDKLLVFARRTVREDSPLAKVLVELWGELKYGEGSIALQRKIQVFLLKVALSDNETLANIAVASLANLPVSGKQNIPDAQKTPEQRTRTQEILNDMLSRSPKVVMKELLGQRSVNEIEDLTGNSIARLLTYWSDESEEFAVQARARTPEEIAAITPEQAAKGEPVQMQQFTIENLVYLRPFWEIGAVHSNPIDLYCIKGTDKEDSANWVLLKGGNDYTLSMDYIGTRLFQLAGLPTAPVSLVRLPGGELRLAIGFMRGYEDGGYSLPKKYHKDILTQTGFIFDALINSQDRHPSNMMFRALSYNVSKQDKQTQKIDRIFVDFGASGFSRATGGFTDNFLTEVDEKQLVTIFIGSRAKSMNENMSLPTNIAGIKEGENATKMVNEAYASIVYDYQKDGNILSELAQLVKAVTDEQIEAIVKSAQLPQAGEVANWIAQLGAELFETPQKTNPAGGFWNRKPTFIRTKVIAMLENLNKNYAGVEDFMIKALISRRDSLVKLVK
ncbi:MAG: PHP domain-containing protein, partial [Candidatus Omnitrophota bacterium]